MQPTTPIIERAFAIAKAGICASPYDVRAQLKQEGYTGVEEYIAGRTLTKQLKELCVTTFRPLAEKGIHLRATRSR